jgi:hypothetical protein
MSETNGNNVSRNGDRSGEREARCSSIPMPVGPREQEDQFDRVLNLISKLPPTLFLGLYHHMIRRLYERGILGSDAHPQNDGMVRKRLISPDPAAKISGLASRIAKKVEDQMREELREKQRGSPCSWRQSEKMTPPVKTVTG